MYSLLSTFLKKNNDSLLLKLKDRSVIGGPEYITFKDHIKKELLLTIETQTPSLKYVELDLPSLIGSENFKKFGYSKLFPSLKIQGINSVLKPEGFAEMYGNELKNLRYIYGEDVVYYSLGKSFRDQKSKKNGLIRSREFDQLEFQFPLKKINPQQIIEQFFQFFKKYVDVIKKVKCEQLPFYSQETTDFEILNDPSIELCSISKRDDIFEVSIGMSRLLLGALLSNYNPETNKVNSVLLSKLYYSSTRNFSKKFLALFKSLS
jgi:hypothetical protein